MRFLNNNKNIENCLSYPLKAVVLSVMDSWLLPEEMENLVFLNWWQFKNTSLKWGQNMSGDHVSCLNVHIKEQNYQDIVLKWLDIIL